jgi:hypothetical protein
LFEEITEGTGKRCGYCGFTETTTSLDMNFLAILPLQVIEDNATIILELYFEWLIYIEDQVASLKVFRSFMEMVKSIE